MGRIFYSSNRLPLYNLVLVWVLVFVVFIPLTSSLVVNCSKIEQKIFPPPLSEVKDFDTYRRYYPTDRALVPSPWDKPKYGQLPIWADGGKPMKAEELRLLIRYVLKDFARAVQRPTLYSEDAVELLMLTAAQETHCGRWVMQINGPALGIFQMEPTTHYEIWDKVVRNDEALNQAVDMFFIPSLNWKAQMIGNLPYQIIYARLYFTRTPQPLPPKEDVRAMAVYWKKYWNTPLGKGTVDEAVRRYIRYAYTQEG